MITLFRSLLSYAFIISAFSLTGATYAAQLPPGEQPGVSLGAMRLIYPSKVKSVTLTLTNNTDQTWLAQSGIKKVDFSTGEPTNINGPFVITPPLMRLGPWKKTPVRIIYTGNTLPEDRESVFYITVRMLPQVTRREQNEGGSMNIGLINDIKLFYRPSSLEEGGVAEASKKLTARTDSDQIILTNPTPYYITLDHLTVNGKAVEEKSVHKMIPPRGVQYYPIPKGVMSASGKAVIRWSVIDELGNKIPGQV